ncbi:hypothetical protein [Thalassobellus suaedae]|uniref:Class I SAM-dependent methyltransferase n=1 Tax=Thalassobellus suaedae TaxID=3074124 RepID=A0ABY9Y061_9FLAO|nr:class I SAM-dependent methyltransferase [Flavobacteriaceae bacterium HL-DH10]
MHKRIAFSCVLDYSPLMATQAYIWLVNLISIGVKPETIFIHIVGNVPQEFLEYLNTKQVNIIKKTSFDARNKYCNKLVQLKTFEQLDGYDYVFLMDCDTAVVSLDGLVFKKDVYAKVVDFPNPPLNILERIFSEHNYSVNQAVTTFPLKEEQLTDWNNCNGGLYIISKTFLKTLKPAWERYALWCIEHADLFGEKYDKHADQVGFTLAMASLGKKTTHLGVEWNYPIHVKTNLNVSPKIIHFHVAIDTQIKLKKIGLYNVDNVIDIVNKRISNSIRSSHLNSIFWDFRYAFFPELGSGIGSRGYTLLYKRKLLKSCFGNNSKVISVLDVGCGDLEIIHVFDFKEYLGLDLSLEAVKKGRIKKPNWNFELIGSSIFDFDKKDIVICLDVLIHQKKYKSYLDLVNSIVQHTNLRLIIAAYDNEPNFISDITFYHEPITETLTRVGDFERIYKVGEYNSTSVIIADKKECGLMRVKPAKFSQNEKDSLIYRILKKIKKVIK